MVLLECSSIKKRYGKKEVLNGACLTVRAGELVGLAGENGSGKSTLLRCILNREPCSGRVEISTSVGYCPQDDFLYKVYRVQEHIELVLSIAAKEVQPDYEYAEELVRLFRLEGYLDYPIGNLSSGTYQKLKFITPLLTRPGLLVLDEPYDGFDWNMYQMFWQVIDRLKAEGTGILLVSHFLHDFKRFDRIYGLKNGRTEIDT